HRASSPTASSALDISPPKRWRQFIPAWIRSLIWIDSAANYDAFLSYSWKGDSQVAPVIQSLIQQFLCPWYKPRAKTIFRDLSSLPAGSSLEAELFARLDKSRHFIALVSPAAAKSGGMEKEARHWFSREREGHVLIVVTEGNQNTWEGIRDQLLPSSLSERLVEEPLWIPLQHRRQEILSKPANQKLRGELTEDLKQLLLRFHPGRDWGQLRGEESAQRRRAVRLMAGV